MFSLRINKSNPRVPKLPMRTRRSSSLSEIIPPIGLARIPAKLRRDMAVLVETVLNPKSSLKTRGSQAMNV